MLEKGEGERAAAEALGPVVKKSPPAIHRPGGRGPGRGWRGWTGLAEGPGTASERQPWAHMGTEQERTQPLDSLDTDVMRYRSTGRTEPEPALHDAASGLVRVWVFESQSLLRPVLLQVGELLAVDGPTALPADKGKRCVMKSGLDPLLAPGSSRPWRP